MFIKVTETWEYPEGTWHTRPRLIQVEHITEISPGEDRRCYISMGDEGITAEGSLEYFEAALIKAGVTVMTVDDAAYKAGVAALKRSNTP